MSETAEQGISVTLGDGAVIKGANLEEALESAKQMIEARGTSYKEQKQRAEEAEAEAARLRAEVEARQQVIAQQRAAPSNAFDSEHYYELLNSDPIAAQNFRDKYRFGVEDSVMAFNSMREEAWQNVQQNVTAAFLASHADFNPADASALRGRVEACLQYGMPFNAVTLDYAYQTLKNDGTAKPLELAPPEPEPAPPPVLSGSTGELGMVDADSMSDAQLEKYLRQAGMLR